MKMLEAAEVSIMLAESCEESEPMLVAEPGSKNRFYSIMLL